MSAHGAYMGDGSMTAEEIEELLSEYVNHNIRMNEIATEIILKHVGDSGSRDPTNKDRISRAAKELNANIEFNLLRAKSRDLHRIAQSFGLDGWLLQQYEDELDRRLLTSVK